MSDATTIDAGSVDSGTSSTVGGAGERAYLIVRQGERTDVIDVD